MEKVNVKPIESKPVESKVIKTDDMKIEKENITDNSVNTRIPNLDVKTEIVDEIQAQKGV